MTIKLTKAQRETLDLLSTRKGYGLTLSLANRVAPRLVELGFATGERSIARREHHIYITTKGEEWLKRNPSTPKG